MQTKKLIFLAIIWAISILLFTDVLRPTYLVEKTQEVLNFDFPSKDDYVSTVEMVRSIVGWFSVLYFAALTFLTFRVFQPQGRFQ
jgi:hypothetical protein